MTDMPLWTPSPERAAASQVMAFMAEVNRRHGLCLKTYRDLHAWSVEHPDVFWDLVWDFCGVIGEKGASPDRWRQHAGREILPRCQAQFRRKPAARTGQRRRAGVPRRGQGELARLTWDELQCAGLARCNRRLQAAGVGQGDRVAAMLPNLPETIALMLAVTSLGAIWSSCSPDFGERGVLDRFGQIEPKVFVAVDGYWYNGKRALARRQAQGASSRNSRPRRRSSSFPIWAKPRRWRKALPRAVTLDAFLEPFAPKPLTFERLPFNHPAFILYSSGTTGVPKCIVHGAGGTLLQHLKEHRLQCDVRAGDRVFYFTTCGWMMWNWLVSGLASGATLMLYDGSPFAPKPSVLFDYAQDEKITLFGTSAKYIDACKKAGLEPAKHARSVGGAADDLDRLAARRPKASITSTTRSKPTCISPRSPAAPISCRASCSAIRPRRSGAAKSRRRASAWRWMSGRRTASPSSRRRASWSALKPFASMPVMFWNDPDGKKYRAAYFERFPDVWCHGDFAEWTKHGGMIIHGRSDATLNPGGVRIGTAEIYAQVEQIPEVLEAIAIGQDWDNDVRVVLFVRLQGGRHARRCAARHDQEARSAPARRRAMCRRRSCRSPTSRAPSPARSPSLRCATWCMAAR